MLKKVAEEDHEERIDSKRAYEFFLNLDEMFQAYEEKPLKRQYTKIVKLFDELRLSATHLQKMVDYIRIPFSRVKDIERKNYEIMCR